MAKKLSSPCKCANCGWIGEQIDTNHIRDIHERVKSGDPMPAGECPECRALAYAPGRYCLIRHGHVAGHHYTVARLVEVDGRELALIVRDGKNENEFRHFYNKREALSYAKQRGGVVVPELYEETREYLCRFVRPRATNPAAQTGATAPAALAAVED